MGRTKILLPAAFLIGMLVWPAMSLAGAPTGNGGGAIKAGSQAVPNGAFAPVVPGATVNVVNWSDAQAWHGAPALASSPDGTYYAADPGSSPSDVWANLDIPAGSTLARIDAYGYRAAAGPLSWTVFDVDSVDGSETILAHGNSASGTGVIQTTYTSFSNATVDTGHRFEVDLRNSTNPGVGFVGVVYQYFPPTLTFVPITPTRVLDTRNGTGGLSGPFSNHVARTFQVTGSSGVPTGAKAVTGNLTVTGQTSAGYLYIGPTAQNNPTSSTLNFPVGDDRANAVTVALSATGTLSITFVAPTNGPTAYAIFDVTGYYQ
jgi:hypothetical protein